jgi:hypothetical protein
MGARHDKLARKSASNQTRSFRLKTPSSFRRSAGAHLVAARRSRHETDSCVMSANAADLVPAVEAYLEANGLKETLSAMKAEAKAKKMTPSKTVRARTDARRAPRDERHRRNLRRFLRRLIDTAPPPRPPVRGRDPRRFPDRRSRRFPHPTGEEPERRPDRDGQRVHGNEVRPDRRRRPPLSFSSAAVVAFFSLPLSRSVDDRRRRPTTPVPRIHARAGSFSHRSHRARSLAVP